MKSRYAVMKKSEQKTSKGYHYPDVLTFPIKKFVFKDEVKEVELTQEYIEKFYLLCFREYRVNHYDDIILWLNGIDSIHNVEIGKKIYLPSKKDLERFLIRNRVKNDN